MKISIVHYSAPPVVGGVERVIEAHAAKFSEAGFRVNIIAGKGRYTRTGVSTRVIPEMRPLYAVDRNIHEEIAEGTAGPGFMDLKNLLRSKLRSALKKTDVCIIHNVLTMHFNLALTAALSEITADLKETKFISWIHDATFSDKDYREFQKSKYPWNLLKTPLTEVTNIAISQYRRNKTAAVLKVPRSSIRVVPDGIDPVSFLKIKPATNDFFDSLNLYSSDFILLYPTRIVKRKNIEYAIRITSAMNKKGKKTCLLVTSQPDPYNRGSMLYFKKLKKLAAESSVKDRVIFISDTRDGKGRPFKVDEHILRDLYLLSDLLLFTSRSEGFGIPMLEAGISRLPIACCRIPPLSEIGGEDVIYLDPKQPLEKTSEKLISYLDGNLQVPMFKKIFREYTWDAIFEKKILPLVEG